MTFGDAIFQGIVQGLTEFLPVSSSGHLSLIQYFTGQSGETGILFSILLHMGTLLAVFIAFYQTIVDLIVEFFSMIGDIFRGKFSVKNASPERRMIFLLFVSLLPMFLSVFLLDYFDAMATDNGIIAEGVCFLITSILLFTSDRFAGGTKTAKDMRYRDAIAVGVTQALAPFPGISRSGSTISTGLIFGLEREFAVAFSFIMGVPTILGANVMQLRDISQQGMAVSAPVLLAGILASLVFGLLAIRLVKWLVVSDKFVWFAWYTLILGVLVIGIGIFERFSDHTLQNAVVTFLR